MAVVDETSSLNSSSFHKDRTEHASNQSSATIICSPERRQRDSLDVDDDAMVVLAHNVEVVSLGSSKEDNNEHDNDDDDDDDDSDDDDTHDYLLDSLLSRNMQNSLSLDSNNSMTTNTRPRMVGGRSELDRTYSQRSLRSSSKGGGGEDLDRTYSSRSLSCADRTVMTGATLDDSDPSWTTGSSIHSSATEFSDKKNWDNMDSVHSSTAGGAAGVNISLSEFGNGSMDFNDSCCSFASFGGSDSDLDGSANDLSVQRAAFTSLVDQPTPRRIMLKSQSVRTIKRGMSYRGTGLSLIEESNSLD